MDAGKNRDTLMGTIFRLFKDRALVTLFLQFNKLFVINSMPFRNNWPSSVL